MACPKMFAYQGYWEHISITGDKGKEIADERKNKMLVGKNLNVLVGYSFRLYYKMWILFALCRVEILPC